MKPNGYSYYQDTKDMVLKTSLDELNIFGSHVAYEGSTELCEVGLSIE